MSCRAQLLNPPRAFKDVDIDDVPEHLREIAEAIYDAGAEDLFFQVWRQSDSRAAVFSFARRSQWPRIGR